MVCPHRVCIPAKRTQPATCHIASREGERPRATRARCFTCHSRGRHDQGEKSGAFGTGSWSAAGSFSSSSRKLAEAGIESNTLQRHLAQGNDRSGVQKRLYVLDESSLASTKQMNEFLHRLKDSDRVLLVGDTGQHQAVEAGTPYQQLKEAGIQTARLDEIIRRKDPALKEVVEHLSRGEVKPA